MSKIICFLNQKGGVAKTTTTRNAATAFVKNKKKVLVIDLDPQGNCTSGLGVDKYSLKNSISELLEERNFDIIKTDENIDLIPANITLARTEQTIISSLGRESLLKEGLKEIKKNYDYILIDCPPSLSILTINALTAADEIIVPVTLTKYAFEGLTDLIDTVNNVKKKINYDLADPLVLITRYDKRKSTFEKYADGLKQIFGENLFKTKIRENIAIEKAHENSISVFMESEGSYGAKDYMSFVKEYLKMKGDL